MPERDCGDVSRKGETLPGCHSPFFPHKIKPELPSSKSRRAEDSRVRQAGTDTTTSLMGGRCVAQVEQSPVATGESNRHATMRKLLRSLQSKCKVCPKI